MADMIPYVKTTDISSDVSLIIEAAQRSAYTAVDQILVIRNWLLGKRIAEEGLTGSSKERYGAQIIVSLSKKLTAQYGGGFDKRTLYRCVQFYQMFPDIVATVRPQSSVDDKSEIVAAVRSQSRMLSWSHYRILLQVSDSDAREWYAKEAYEEAWSSRTLQRNVSSQYYYRMLKTQDPSGVRTEMQVLTSPYQNKLEFIRNPVIAEFLGMEQDKKYHESDLEQTIINNIQKFMMEDRKSVV